MSVTVREAALAALFARVQAIATAYGNAAVAERNPIDEVQTRPRLRQFDIGDDLDERHDTKTAYGSDICTQPVEILLYLEATTEDALTAAFDALRGLAIVTILADPLLGGAVDDLRLVGSASQLAYDKADMPRAGWALKYELDYTTAEANPFVRGS